MKLVVAGIILILLPFWSTKIIGIICILGGILIGFKNFLFELIDHIKGTGSNKAAPKGDRDTTPPWEK